MNRHVVANSRSDIPAVPVPVPSEGMAVSIAAIFAREMETREISLDDSFFDLGGDSLMAENIIIAVQTQFGVALPTAALLEAPTPRKLSVIVRRALGGHPASKLIVPMSSNPDREPLVMIHGMSGSPLFSNRFGAGIRERFNLLAVRGMGLQPREDPYSDMRELSQNYFDGIQAVTGTHPRCIGGLCVGGLVAMEIGQMSHAATGLRPSIVLIDPPPLGSAWLRPARDNRMSATRERQLNRQVRFWRSIRDIAVAMGLGQSAIGRKARRETFKKSLTRSVAGYVPVPYPCDILIIASSEWGKETVEAYRNWASDDIRIDVRIVPGQHREFRKADMSLIDRWIIDFLEKRGVRLAASA